MADRVFVPFHNVLVDLDVDAPGANQVAEMLTFLGRSRVSYALTASPSISLDVLRDFWTDISYDTSVHPPVIRTSVANREIAFSVVRLRRILRLGTDETDNGPTEFSEDFIAGALSRMGYVGPRRGRYFTKSLVYGQWRFLWHVMAHVFAARKTGYDELSPTLLSGLLSLVYNKRLSFSHNIFQNFVGQVTGSVKSRFLLYPRFTMLIIHYLLPDFPSVPSTLQVNIVGLRAYSICFTHDNRRPEELRPTERPLFGAVVNPDYSPPSDNGWDDIESTAIIVAPVAVRATSGYHTEPAQLQAPEDADSEVKRLKGEHDQDLSPSETSTEGLKMIALKGKRKVSDMEGELPRLRSGRNTRSASRQLLLENVAQEKLKVETEVTDDNSQVPIPSETEPDMADACPESSLRTKPSTSSVPPTASSDNNPKLVRKKFKRALRVKKLISRVRKLKKVTKKLSSELQFVTESAVEQNKTYKLLLRLNNHMLDNYAGHQKEIDALKLEIHWLKKNRPAQGGVVRQLREDSDNDDLTIVETGKSDELASPSNDNLVAGPSNPQGESIGKRTRRKKN